ncbi:MAG: hypothetical protein KC435_00310 [Thermomicrobiales bacterium]|nr:hypothetical protein [Thermomicrobiales bacterium]
MQMEHGPVDFIMIGFPDSQASPRVAEGIRELEESGTIQVIDLIFVSCNLDGDLRVVELNDLGEGEYEAWETVVEDVGHFFSEDDALQLSAGLAPGTSAVLVLYENTWARALTTSVFNAQGSVMLNMRIPREVVADLVGNIE